MLNVDRLEKLRKERGYTQEQMADMLQIDQAHYCRVERGAKVCTLAVAEDIARVLGTTLDYLVGRDKD